jgi:hypothetical protein
MPKILDLKKECKQLYNPPSKKVVMVQVPSMNFLMVDGKGDPNKAAVFQEAIEALYSLSYTIKFMIKKSEGGIDYAVMPLEGLWWTEDKDGFNLKKRSSWKWNLMIMQPDFVTGKTVNSAMKELNKKKNPPALPKIKYEKFAEGKSAQTIHIGPFSSEGPTIAGIHEFILQSGSKPKGRHHEIYLSDFRRVAPEKMKTVVRQPME